MTLVSGDLQTVTPTPSVVRKIWVRAARTHPSGTGLVLDEPVPVTVLGGRVEFTAKPGPATMVLVRGTSQPAESIALLIPDESSATLAECAEAIHQWDPPVVAAAQRARDEAQAAAKTAARDAVAEADELLADYITRVTTGMTRAETAATRAESAADRVGTAEQVGQWARQAQAGAERVGSAERVLEAERVAVDAAAEAVAASMVSGRRRVDMVNPTAAEIDAALDMMPAGSTVMNLTTGEVWGQ